jgi:hypothetical protein
VRQLTDTSGMRSRPQWDLPIGSRRYDAVGGEDPCTPSECSPASGCDGVCERQHSLDDAVICKHVSYRHCDDSNTYDDAHSRPNSCSNAKAGCCPLADTGTSSTTSTGSRMQGSSAEQSMGI